MSEVEQFYEAMRKFWVYNPTREWKDLQTHEQQNVVQAINVFIKVFNNRP